MKTSRQRILEYIQSHRAVTIGELSDALHMTEANARHHLAILQERDLVEVVAMRPPKGKGRPCKVFSPSEQALGHNLDRLTAALLSEFGGRYGPGERLDLLQGAAERLAGQVPSVGSLTGRLSLAVQQLNQLNYHARWEAHGAGPHMILGHCPYAPILSEHPELCHLDAALLERLLGGEVEQLAKQALDERGIPHCVFHLSIKGRGA
jgi:predicted ArsR family transcriptional regulator